ncbi:penicillin-binding transpeptidase domain-containing protein [Oerskovia douganii]|uniref:penicillin-binding transpeptidase domain-containing protein n=1 Tax=Oerskovia douganii TaxID=2762210 RepID=UPI002AB0A49E|nr:penicillin-binding transpeptidase domain-containing protein [Oerskovia douganii]
MGRTQQVGRRVGARRPGRPTRSRRALAAAPTSLVVLALTLTACTEEAPGPEAAAKELAAAIADGDFGGVAFSQANIDVPAHRDAVLEPLAAIDHTVTLEGVEVATEGDDEGRRATATLAYTWDVTDTTPWAYETSVDLVLQDPQDGDGPQEWAVVWEPDVLVPDLRDGDRLAVTRVRAERAQILGADGAPIVEPRPVHRIGVDKMNLDPARQDAVARAVGAAVGIDVEAYAQKVAGAGDKAFVEAIVVRADDTAGIDLAAVRAIDGVSVVDGELDLAPTRTFARPILGRVGDATAEAVEESGGQVVAGDTIGLSGLQRQYDVQLRGTPGITISVVADGSAGEDTGQDLDLDGAPDPVEDVTDVFAVEPVAGVPLATTLRTDMQVAAEAVLAGVPSASAIVAVQPSTGDVLAAASGPGGDGTSTATTGKYAPGSTFKVASTLAMLRAGVTPETVVSCTPTITVDGREFQNVPGFPQAAIGEVPFRTAFANSCNTAMIAQREAVSQQALHDAAADLGLGVESALGAPGYFGSVPASAEGTEHAASMIGQGKVEASPLGMATLAASVAQGSRVSPVLVRPEVTPAAAEAPAPSGLTPEEAGTLRSLMRSVVTDGSARLLLDLPGEVGAKTGTAQYGDGSLAHAWMIAIQGDLAVAVFVETGDSGSGTAGPLMKAFLDAPDAGVDG